ncbi:MAG: hypothetical protein N2170_09045 [Bacteroidia bacterium]|nr:hypothetical protein [Bacteroidia bacterium]
MKRLQTIMGGVLLTLLLSTLGCKKDPCKDVTCQNGGTCVDGKCNCSLPWEGTKCEVDARDKFAGAWSGTENCGGGVENVSTTISKSSVEAIAILIDGQIRGRLTSSTTFEIPSQQINSGGTTVTISGNGVLNGNTLSLTITYSVGGQGITCSYSLTRQ